MAEAFNVVVADGTVLAGERAGRPGAPAVVLLHANVADRRSWQGVLDELRHEDLDLVAYDRRGFGGTSAQERPFSHLDDLVAVMDAMDAARVVLVGNSMGGALALDLALIAPERVAAVLLVGAGVSGMTDEDTPFDWVLDPATEALLAGVEQAAAAGDVEARVRALLHLWLDGPDAREGRVGGAARELAAAMNRRVLELGATEEAGDPGLDAWSRLGGIDVPVLAVWGALDAPADQPFYAETVRRLPDARGRVLEGTAHLPSLEMPEAVAVLVLEAVGLAR